MKVLKKAKILIVISLFLSFICLQQSIFAAPLSSGGSNIYFSGDKTLIIGVDGNFTTTGPGYSSLASGQLGPDSKITMDKATVGTLTVTFEDNVTDTVTINSIMSGPYGGSNTKAGVVFDLKQGTLNVTSAQSVMNSGQAVIIAKSFEMKSGTLNATNTANGSPTNYAYMAIGDTTLFSMSGGTLNVNVGTKADGSSDTPFRSFTSNITGGTINSNGYLSFSSGDIKNAEINVEAKVSNTALFIGGIKFDNSIINVHVNGQVGTYVPMCIQLVNSTLTKSTINTTMDNITKGNGGAIWANGGTIKLIDSTLNLAGISGGLGCNAASIEILGSTVNISQTAGYTNSFSGLSSSMPADKLIIGNNTKINIDLPGTETTGVYVGQDKGFTVLDGAKLNVKAGTALYGAAYASVIFNGGTSTFESTNDAQGGIELLGGTLKLNGTAKVHVIADKSLTPVEDGYRDVLKIYVEGTSTLIEETKLEQNLQANDTMNFTKNILATPDYTWTSSINSVKIDKAVVTGFGKTTITATHQNVLNNIRIVVADGSKHTYIAPITVGNPVELTAKISLKDNKGNDQAGNFNVTVTDIDTKEVIGTFNVPANAPDPLLICSLDNSHNYSIEQVSSDNLGITTKYTLTGDISSSTTTTKDNSKAELQVTKNTGTINVQFDNSIKENPVTPVDPTEPEKNVFKKTPSTTSLYEGSYVEYIFTEFSNSHPGPIKNYQIYDLPPVGLEFVSGRLPAFNNGEGVTYSITYKTVDGKSGEIANNVDASKTYAFDAPKTISSISEIVLNFKEVPSQFGKGDKISHKFKVGKPKEKVLVNKGKIKFTLDGKEVEILNQNDSSVKIMVDTSDSTSTTSLWLATTISLVAMLMLTQYRKKKITTSLNK